MVAEVRLTDAVEARDVGHQVVVDPEPTHGVVGGRVDPHRDVVRVLVGYAVVHLEEVGVAVLDDVAPLPCDGVGEVEEHTVLQRADATARVDHALGGP